MAAVKDAKTIGPAFTNAEEVVRVTYDFAKDAGAVGALDLFTAEGSVAITYFHAYVVTACTSGGSATVKVGKTGDDDLMFGTTTGAVASLTAGAFIKPDVVEGTPNVVALPTILTDGQKLLQTIGTAALTAGKIEYVIKYVKVA